MYCQVCYVNLDKNSSPKLPCGCTNCSDCLTNWIVTKAKELHYQTYEKIPCMNSYCKQPFKAEEVASQLREDQQRSINEVLFDVYLKKTQDIRRCPNNACSYAGIIDLSFSCVDNLECSLCGKEWREKIHLSAKEKVKEFFCENNTQRSELLCELWEEMFTRRCPSCGVSIQKNGGCDHMTCRKCQFEFCWLCAQKHQNHSRKFCISALLAKVLILFMAVINIMWMIGLIHAGVSLLLWIIDFLLKSTILNALVIGTYFFIAILRKKKRKILVVLALLLLFLVAIINYFKLYFSLLKVASIELVLLGLMSLYEKKMKIWLYSIF